MNPIDLHSQISDFIYKSTLRAEAHENLDEVIRDYLARGSQSLEVAVFLLCFINFRQWTLEDKIRQTELTSDDGWQIARAIRVSNDQRVTQIEIIDNLLCGENKSDTIQPSFDYDKNFINSETPGQVIDRLSVLHIRLFALQKASSEYSTQIISGIPIMKASEITSTQIQFVKNVLFIYLKAISGRKAILPPTQIIKLYQIIK
jgi:hypothetical protein